MAYFLIYFSILKRTVFLKYVHYFMTVRYMFLLENDN